MHPTTTSRSWAAFMNGNPLLKVRTDPALSAGIIFVCSLTPLPSGLGWRNWCDPDQSDNRGQNGTPGQREPAGIFTEGNLAQVTSGPLVRWMRH